MKRILLFGSLLALLPASTAARAQSPAQWRLSADLRIGSLDDPDQSLTWITGVNTGRDGRIYIAQAQTHNVRIYEPDGRFVRTIGGKGSGPGEFERLGVPLWRGDSLYISDSMHRRVTMFSADGDLLATLPVMFNAQPPLSPGGVLRMLDDGSILVGFSVRASAVADGSVTAVPVLRLDRSAAVLDTALWSAVGGSQLSIRLGTGQLFSSQPFPDDPIRSIGQRRILVAERPVSSDPDEGRFRLHWVAFSGDTLLSRSYRYTPKPLDEAIAERVVAARVESYGQFAQRSGVSRNDLEKAIRDVLHIPRFLPPIAGVVVSREGEAWLRREDLPGDSVQWNVLSPAGDVRAVFPLSKGMRPILIEGDVLYSVERDELDVPYLVRYRIDRSG